MEYPTVNDEIRVEAVRESATCGYFKTLPVSSVLEVFDMLDWTRRELMRVNEQLRIAKQYIELECEDEL